MNPNTIINLIITAVIAVPIALIISIIMLIASASVIPQGYVGIVTLYGKMSNNILSPGIHFLNPLKTVYKMPTKFIPVTTESNVLTADNLNITVEVTLLYKISKFKSVYKNFSSSFYEINKRLIEPSLHSAVREACSSMDWDTITIHRELLKTKIKSMLSEVISNKGFAIKNVMINDVQPPQKIKDAVMDKLKSQQEVAQMSFEKQKAEKEAKIKIIEARGIAKSQEIIQQRLTPLYVQYYAIKSYQLLAKSPNKTFVVLPTSANGSGLPMILNANK
jgi:regulator of protease activity HflC (stomatin/prohibitin superfamily)